MLIFFFGEDDFRSAEKLIELKAKYFEKDKSGSGLSLFDAYDRPLLEKIREAIETPNLFASKRFVVLKNMHDYLSLNDQKELVEVLKSKKINEDDSTIVVFYESANPKKNSSLFKFLDSHSKKQEFEKLSGTRLKNWILERIKKQNSASGISSAGLDALIRATHGDSRMLHNEILKLGNFAKGRMISGEDVGSLVSEEVSVSIFQMLDAIVANNKQEALKYYRQALQGNLDPFYVMSMLVYQFRTLGRLIDLWEKEKMNENEIARTLKMHPYAVRKNLSQIRFFDMLKIKKIYQDLAEMDQKAKLGQIDLESALLSFIVKI